jgi:hypothetical protein
MQVLNQWVFRGIDFLVWLQLCVITTLLNPLSAILCVLIGLNLLFPSLPLLFFCVIWFFPERVLGVLALSVYLFIWLPSRYLPAHVHLTLLAVYMLNNPPRWKGFRSWSGWDVIRNRLYPVKYDRSDPPTHPDRIGTPRIYAIAPHGLYGEGVHLSMVLTAKFVDVVPVGSSVMTWIPIVKGESLPLDFFFFFC